MDSGNGNNQQQRYCPTPIMAPPSVATSPPGISGGNVMGSMHQAPHHPSPSISPHPASAYYTHHSAGGGHYPTPSPTPPPPPSIHHQQYYAHQQHPYYAHGSHQQAQQAQSHQPHHGMSGAHVGMSAPSPGATPQGQHPHLMSHGSYHHPSQPQSHHQQWAAPSHTHQQQSHHYYHQAAHHTPPQQQPQQQGYPPPPHSPYPYSQAHSAAPTPPPQQQQQQQLPPPPVPASPGPSQMHQAPQQSQSHALINLSRFVSQQSTSPSPRASPSLPHQHHQQQISQMGPHSPAPFGGHMDHHTMNGHSNNMGPSSTPPVMSPPPPMGHGQQAMSPPPVMPMPQHHLPPQSPNPYNVNGGGNVMDRHSPIKAPAMSPDIVSHEADFREFEAHNNKVIKEREQDMRNMFPELSPGLCTKDNDDVNNVSAVVNNEPPPVSSAIANSNSNNNAANNDLASIMNSNSSEGSFPNSSPVRRDSVDSCNTTPQPDIPRPNGSGTEASPPKDSNSVDWEHGRSSVSPQAKSMGSPTNSGNGHQMMPVRLQNMQKGARTKASMKKLMQEQQITTPNGQASDISSDGVGGTGKDGDLELEMDSVEVSPKGKGKSPTKASRKKKSQTPVVAPDTNTLTVNQLSEINPDLSENDATTAADPVARPGYTKSGKKIGRPRKGALAASTSKGKGKKGKSNKKGQNAVTDEDETVPEPVDETLTVPPSEADPSDDAMQLEVDRENQSGRKGSPKRRATKASRKRSSKVLSDTSDLQEVSDLSSLASPNQFDTSTDENNLTPVTPIAKGRKRAKASPKSSPPEPAILESIPTSKITEQTAKSVAGNYQAPVVATGRSKKRGKQSVEPEPIPEENSMSTPVAKEKKGSRKKISASPAKDALDPAQEHGDLPRLRSRSPKQTDSPPLRLSSPRAAKERSTTPAANNASQRSSRASRSREKDAAPVTTPLASPATRSPKKVTEKPEKGSRSRPAKNKQAPNESQELHDEYLSPPPVKRTRQISKESSESGEVSRRSRKGIVEARASVDSDRSLLSVGKRASRRKSGSVSGSTDRDSIASPSFNQSGSSQIILPPAEVSFEAPSEVTPISANKNKRPKKKKTSYPVKRGKGKAAQSKSRKTLAKSAKNVVIAITEEPQVPADVNGITIEPDSTAPSEGCEPTLPTPTPSPKTKNQKKPYVKKGKKSSLTLPAPVALDSAPVEESQEIVPEVPVTDDQAIGDPVPVKGKKKSAKKSKKNVSSEDSVAVLSIPEPQPTPTPPKKKSRKTKLENKKPKAPKKSNKKKPEAPKEKDPYHFDSSDFTATGSSASVATDEDSKVGTGFVFSPPQSLTLGRRRRSSSAMSPLNTQTSAKSGTGSGTESSSTKVKPGSEEGSGSGASPSSTPRGNVKPLRRDSRSLSREYNDLNQVSVVLSDIARSPEFSNMNRLSPSVPDYLGPPPQETFAPVTIPKPESTALYGSPESASASTSLSFAGKSEDPSDPVPAKGKKQAKALKKIPSIDLGGVKKESKKKSSSKSLSHKMEMEERKKQLEVEVAQIILNFSSGASSKGSSPAKSIPSMDVSEAPPVPKSPKKRSSKATKSGRRRKSTSPRISVDNTNSIKQEDIVPSIEGEMDQSLGGSVTGTNKRKSVKSRRSSVKSASKKSSAAAAIASPMMASYSTQSPNSGVAAEAFGQSLPLPSPTPQGSSIKVAKTAVIPTASSLGIPEPLPSPIVAPTDKKGKVKKEKTAKKRKAVISSASPDITAGCPPPLAIRPEITATSTPKPKRKRPVKKEVKLEESIDPNQSESAVVLKVETSGETGMESLPAKKKRQRKPKVSAAKTNPDVEMPSTSAAAIMALPVASTSKLFPYQTESTPYKKPTVVARSVSGLQLGNKADDNQKNKGKDKDGPSVRVLGGLAKFYRGGEEEEVDPDPKLPKQEKGQLPTDSAVPWICSFCHLGPHAQKLGDLFGPYFADLPAIYGTLPRRETWIHGDCSLWAGRLILVGTSLRRLEETLVNADKETCTICKRTGATIGCLRRGCKEAVHYPCAIRKFWKMDDQNFHSYCPKHSS